MHPFRLFAFFLLLIFPLALKAAPPTYSIVWKAASAKQNAVYGVIDNSGKVIVPCSYGYIQMDPAGYFRAWGNDGWVSILDKDGKLLFKSAAFSEVGNCGNGLFPVQDKVSQLWGYADLQGKIRITPVYTEAKTFVSGLAVVLVSQAKNEKDKSSALKETIINLDGKMLLDFSQCQEVHDIKLFPFSDSLVKFTAEANALTSYGYQADNEVAGFITTAGQLLKDKIYRTHSQFYAIPPEVAGMPFGYPLPNESYCYCAQNGTIVIPGPFGVAHPFSSDGIAMVTDKNGTYYIDRSGKPICDPKRFSLGEQMPGGANLHHEYDNNRIIARDRKENRNVYLDSKGRVAITLDSGMRGMDFHEGIAAVWRYLELENYSYVWTWIDTTGKILAPFDTVRGLDSPQRYTDRPLIYYDTISKHHGLRKADNKIIAAPEWGYIRDQNGVFLVREGPGKSYGPEFGSSRACGALNDKGILITKDYDRFSDFTCFSYQEESTARITGLNFTGKELGEQIIDVLGIRADVDSLREYYRKQAEKKEEGEDGN